MRVLFRKLAFVLQGQLSSFFLLFLFVIDLRPSHCNPEKILFWINLIDWILLNWQQFQNFHPNKYLLLLYNYLE
jgi:hypothetical protein